VQEDFVKHGIVVLAVLWMLVGHAAIVAEESKPTRPNIVIVLADDLGWGDLGCYGATKVQTPHCDRLAREGMRFTDAHSPCSVCTPSRYNLLTGRYAWRTWVKTGCVWANDPLLVEERRMTLPLLLRSAGYATACVGKWHLGFGKPGTEGWDDVLGPDYNRELKPGPLEVGFDYFFGIPHVGQLPHFFIENHGVVNLDASDPIRVLADTRPGWNTDYLHRSRTENPNLGVSGGKQAAYQHEELAIKLTEKAVAWIAQQKNERPFFLHLCHRNVHGPIAPAPQFRNTSQCGAYGDFIHELDWSVGEILRVLDQRGLTPNTVVILSSDNGAVNQGYRPGPKAEYQGHFANGPLRGQKTEIYEGGHRVPFLVRWPGRVAPASRCDQLTANTDLLATTAEIVGQRLADNAGEDSFSFLSALLQQKATQPLRDTIVNDSWKGQYAIRQGNWKLLLCQGGGGLGWKAEVDAAQPAGQLFNLTEDLGENQNLYDAHPEIVQRLTTLFKAIGRNNRSRPLFQTMSYHNTPEKPLPEMRWIDSAPKPGVRHEYHASTVNSVDLKSKPARSTVQ
jgi:arylsulfatase A